MLCDVTGINANEGIDPNLALSRCVFSTASTEYGCPAVHYQFGAVNTIYSVIIPFKAPIGAMAIGPDNTIVSLMRHGPGLKDEEVQISIRQIGHADRKTLAWFATHGPKWPPHVVKQIFG